MMLPMGALVELASGPVLAKLDNVDSSWPDSISSERFQIQGYTLNRDRRPTFNYIFDQITVEDFFEPEMEGKYLTRTLSYINPEKMEGVWARVIAADIIEDLGEGIFRVNGGQYYLKIAAYTLENTEVRKTTDGQEMLIRLPAAVANGEIKYSIIF